MPPRLTRVHVALLLAILGLGGALRIARWSEERRSLLARAPMGDEGSYDAWARALSQGAAPDQVPYMAPLPAYVLAAAHRRAAPAEARDLYRLGAVGLGLITIVLVFLCGRELSGSRVGLVAAFLVATHRPLIYFEPTLLRDGPAAALLTAATWALLRSRRARPGAQVAWALAAGLALGVGALVRENLFLVGVLAGAGLAWAAWRGLGPSAQRRAAWGSAVALGLGLALPLSPWWVSNYRLEGRPSPLVTWNGGCVFYIHNRTGNRSAGYIPPPFLEAGNPEGEQAGFRREAERLTGRSMTPHEVSSFWLRAGVRDVLAWPTLYLLKVLGRLRTLLVSRALPQARDPTLDARDSVVLQIPMLGFGFLIAFAALGACLGGPRSRSVALIALAAIAVTLPVAFLSRYRIAIVPLVAILAAVGLSRGVLGWRRVFRLIAPSEAPSQSALAIGLSRRGADARAAFGLAAAFAVGVALHLTSPGAYSDAAGRQNRALAALALNEPDAAVETLLACESPTPTVFGILGRAGVRSRRWEAAERGYTGMVAAWPERVDGWLGLSLARLQQGKVLGAQRALEQAKRLEPEAPAVQALERALSR